MQCLSPQEIARIRWILPCYFLLWTALLLAPPQLAQGSWFPLLALGVHVNATRLCILLDALIFALAWNACGAGRLLASVAMAIGFLCAACFDFLYLSLLSDLPAGLPHAMPDAAMLFWLLARSVTGAGLVVALWAAARPLASPWSARVALMLAMTTVSAITGVVLGAFPALSAPAIAGGDGGVPRTILHVLSMALTLCATLLAGLAMRRSRPGKEAVGAPVRVDMLLACIALGLSMPSLAGLPALAGPAFRLVATLLFYRAVLSGSIRAPYATMAQLVSRLQAASVALRRSELRLSGVIGNALDAIIATDEAGKIVLANPAAAAMFGTTLHAMRGSAIERYLPARHHKGFRTYVENFNKVRLTFFKRGGNDADYDVSGLRANGEEFPMEASLSVMNEGRTRFTILILRDISERKKAQEELRRSHAELSRLSVALQSGRETERKHVARDLHDDLGQLLAALRIDLALLQQQAQQAASVKPTQLKNMDDLLSTSIKSLRRIASDLRPRALDEGGLYFALQALRKDFEQRHGIACELRAREDELALDDARTTTLYRIIQEALGNVARHAHAHKVCIAFRRQPGRLELRIEDDGCGIRPDDFLNPAGFGLVDMRERVKAMHGELCVAGEAQRGTRIDIRLPLDVEPACAAPA